MTSPAEDSKTVSDFCTFDNIQSAAVYLSQELQNIGISCRIIESNGERLNVLSLINSCWHLTKLYTKSIRDSNNLHDQRCRDSADINHIQGSLKDMRCTLEEKERHILEANEKDRQTSTINKALASKLKAEKDEVKKLHNMLQQKEAQHHHEMKKQELECNKLKDRLLRLVSGGDKSNRSSSITMTGSLDRHHKLRAKWKTDNTTVKHEEELYRNIFARYESWIEQLTEETHLLKEFISSVTCKVHKMGTACAKSQIDTLVQDKELLNGSLSCSFVSEDSLEEEPIFSLAFPSIRDRLQKGFDDDLYLIQMGLENKGTRESIDTSETRCLQEELLVEGLCVEQKEQLCQEYKKFNIDRNNLKNDKERFAQSLLKLNKEKCAFEIEKVELLRSQFLSELPDSLCNTETSALDVSHGSLSDLYGDSPRQIIKQPTMTSHSGEIERKNNPVTLGGFSSTKLQRSRRCSNASRSSSTAASYRNSAPNTRTPSLNRLHEQGVLPDAQRHRAAPQSPKDRSSYVGLRPGSAQDQSMTRSINCPPVSSQSIDMIGSPGLTWPSQVHMNDLHSIDSGISQESCESGNRVPATNDRLDVLESSLMALLDKIAVRDDTNVPRSQPDSRRSSSYDNEGTQDVLLGRPNYEFDATSGPFRINSASKMAPPPPPSSSRPSRMAHVRPNLPSKLCSAPGSLRSSRKASMDRAYAEEFARRFK